MVNLINLKYTDEGLEPLYQIWFAQKNRSKMEITYRQHINTDKDNRVEFLLVNYDYIDGNEYLAKLFEEEYGFVVDDKIDGWWYNIIRIHLRKTTYELVWHEDTGNEIYSLCQSKEEIQNLQKRLDKVLAILNSRIRDA